MFTVGLKSPPEKQRTASVRQMSWQALRCKDIEIIKSKFVAKPQFFVYSIKGGETESFSCDVNVAQKLTTRLKYPGT